MKKEHLSEMEKAGSLIGSHTVNHPVLSTLTLKEQETEINQSYDFLSSFLDLECRSFCYPYGGTSTYNTETFQALDAAGVHHAFAVNNQELTKIDNKYALPRLDCNRF